MVYFGSRVSPGVVWFSVSDAEEIKKLEGFALLCEKCWTCAAVGFGTVDGLRSKKGGRIKNMYEMRVSVSNDRIRW